MQYIYIYSFMEIIGINDTSFFLDARCFSLHLVTCNFDGLFLQLWRILFGNIYYYIYIYMCVLFVVGEALGWGQV